MKHSNLSISLSQFPQDRVNRQIVSFGPVFRSSNTGGGIVWPTFLKTMDTDTLRPEDVKTNSFNISAAYLPFLKLGSVWCGQDLSEQSVRSAENYEVKVDSDSQKFMRRYDCDETNLPRLLPDNGFEEFPPYVAMEISGVDGVRLAVVRCSELVRFYFGQSSLLAQELFNFDGEGRNERLFDYDKSTWVNDTEQFVLALKQKVGEAEGRYLAMQLAWQKPSDALTYLSRSVRTAMAKNMRPWPKVPLPFSGENVWKVSGQKRLLLFMNGLAVEHLEEVLAITQIAHCSADRTIEKLQLMLPRPSGKTIEQQGSYAKPTVQTVPEKLPWSSEKLPGISVRNSENVVLDLFEGYPGMQVGECVVSFGEYQESELQPYYVAGEKDIEESSAVDGISDETDVGDLTVTPDVPAQNRKVEYQEKEDEVIDRFELPNLFDEPFPETPLLVQTPYQGIPSEFVPTIHAAAQIAKKWPDTIAQWYDRTEVESDCDTGVLIELPDDWGKKRYQRRRRALCLKVLNSHGQAYILDIERQAGHDSFGIHIIYFPDHRPIPLALIGKLMHWRLHSSQCWPDRTTHSGNFWVRRVKHDFGIHRKMRMEGRLTDNLDNLFEHAVND